MTKESLIQWLLLNEFIRIKKTDEYECYQKIIDEDPLSETSEVILEVDICSTYAIIDIFIENSSGLHNCTTLKQIHFK